MQSTTTAKKTGTSAKWCKVGIATREYQALRLSALVGPAAGRVYYIAADDLARCVEESVQVYELRTIQGEQYPTVAGFTYVSTNGTMVIVQLDGPHARVMMPALQLLKHLKPSAANKPTTITAPREEVYSTPSNLMAVPA